MPAAFWLPPTSGIRLYGHTEQLWRLAGRGDEYKSLHRAELVLSPRKVTEAEYPEDPQFAITHGLMYKPLLLIAELAGAEDEYVSMRFLANVTRVLAMRPTAQDEWEIKESVTFDADNGCPLRYVPLVERTPAHWLARKLLPSSWHGIDPDAVPEPAPVHVVTRKELPSGRSYPERDELAERMALQPVDKLATIIETHDFMGSAMVLRVAKEAEEAVRGAETQLAEGVAISGPEPGGSEEEAE